MWFLFDLYLALCCHAAGRNGWSLKGTKRSEYGGWEIAVVGRKESIGCPCGGETQDLWQKMINMKGRILVILNALSFFLSENARGDGRGFRGVASSTPTFNLWPWAWSSGEVLPKGTERNKDHTGHSQGMWHLFAPSLVWSSHAPTCSTFSILLSPWRWFSQHLHSCPCQTCSILWRGWVSRTKTSWGFCSAVLLNWEEGRSHRDIQFWS